MRWIRFVLGKSRGLRNTFDRLPTLVTRFGLTSRKSQAQLRMLLEITERYGVRPTLPVTAVTARRHPKIVRELEERGVEIAAHGYVHNDYASLTREEQFEQVSRARDELAAMGLSVRGWRCPYSRWNSDTLDALRAAGFEYDATPVYAWPAYAQEGLVLSPKEMADYERLCELFGVRDASMNKVLPTMVDGMVQIPMSIPQDEDMVDRLHLDSSTMIRVWHRMLQDSRHRGDVFVICLHPERVSLCAEPLNATLREARERGDVWIATLGEIATWWNERDRRRLTVESSGTGGWTVGVNGSDRMITRVGNQMVTGPKHLHIESVRRPVIHAGPIWPPETLQGLRDAGYITQNGSEQASDCVLDLDRCLPPDSSVDAVARLAEEQSADLVRVSTWPAGYRSCLSVTGDIDALTLFDFAMRLKEF